MTSGRLERLEREHPEWRAWLGVLECTLREAAGSAWEAAVPSRPPDLAGRRPLLAGTRLRVDGARARRWVRVLFDTAAEAGTGTAPARSPRLQTAEALAVLEAALGQDAARLAVLSRQHGWSPEAFHAVAALAVLPLLQAAGRRWAHHLPAGWRAGCCPLCGAWPTLAEARGIERSRRLRCARCGSDWAAEPLRCVYCDNRDHARLGRLVEEEGGERRQVETCAACRGYLKTLTTLQAGPACDVILDDLSSVELDVAALDQGFARPAGPGCPLDVRLEERIGLARRLLTRR
jgi:FdhE protein